MKALIYVFVGAHWEDGAQLAALKIPGFGVEIGKTYVPISKFVENAILRDFKRSR